MSYFLIGHETRHFFRVNLVKSYIVEIEIVMRRIKKNEETCRIIVFFAKFGVPL